MSPSPKHRFWWLCRIYFRRFRIVVWLMVLLLLGCLLYVNQVGLPGFIKKPLLDKVRARGLDLQFSRLRLRWYEGIVADNARFVRADEPLSPRLTLGEVRLLLNVKALRHFQLQVDALDLRRGQLVWPLADTNQPPAQLSIDGIQTNLRFLPGDKWELDNFHAQFAGADIRLSGVLTNASSVRNWKFLQGERAAPTPAAVWQNRLRRLSDTLGQIRFSAPPELRLDVRGDANDLQSFSVRLLVAAPGADTPWGAVSGGRFNGRIFPAGSNELARADLSLEAADAQTQWGTITNFQLSVELHRAEGRSNLITGELNLVAGRVQTRWGSGNNALFSARWLHELTNPVPVSGDCQFDCQGAESQWAKAAQVHFAGRLAAPTKPQPPWDGSWAWWTNLQPYFLQWETHIIDLRSPKLVVEQIDCGGNWDPPRLTITNIQARLYSGRFTAQANLDVASRRLKATVDSNFDPHQIAQLFPESSQRLLRQFVWPSAPRLKANVSFVMPPWTNQPPDWLAAIQPTLSLAGVLNLEQGATYFGPPNPGSGPPSKGIQFSSAQTHFIYSNLCLRLPDLILIRPDGGLAAEHRANDLTHDFYWRISSTLDLRPLRQFLEPGQQRAFDLVTFTQPPVLEAEIWGRTHAPERIGFAGKVSLTNFTFRSDNFTSLQTSVRYTNRCLVFTEPHILCGTQQMIAAGLMADFNSQLVYLTNAFSTADPLIIARAIGPHIVRAIENYRFLRPPVGRVHGTIPMHGEAGADLHFDLDGGPFHWWKFNLAHITGHIHWAGLGLTLTNVVADFYLGKAAGSADFDFRPRTGTEFRFNVGVSDAQFHLLMADLATRTNQLEGRLSANILITRANTEDWRSVQGLGNFDLRDGIIWDIPLFGIFTPVLNGLNPGLGNTRATAATCDLVITNGVCRTSNLEMRTSSMRLQYHGTLDLQGQINARVEAELLRNMWVVGPFLSTVFWPVSKMFEYKVTGQLEDPKSDPVFIIPKLVLFPFHPFRTLKGPRPEEPNASQTNALPRQP